MKKFFKKTSEERGRRKKERAQYQDEQDILHGRKPTAALSTSLGAGGGLNDTSESDRSLLDPRGMVRKKSSRRAVTSTASAAPPISSSPQSTSSTMQQQQQQQRGGGRHFMADYTMGSDTNLNTSSPQSSSSSPPSTVNNNAQQQRQYSPSSNPLSAISTSSSSSPPSQLNQLEKDKLMKQRIKEEQRMHYKSQSSEGSSSTKTYASGGGGGGGRDHMHGVSIGHGGSNYDTPSMNATARRAGFISATTKRTTTTAGATTGTAGTTAGGSNRKLSQEEQDKRTKELIKSQRKEQSQSVAGYRSSAGLSTMSSSSTSTTSYSRSFMKSSTLGDSLEEEEEEEIDQEQYKQLLHPLGGSGGSKEGTGGILNSAMKGRGHQRYSGGNNKNQRADDEQEDGEERRVSFAKDKNIDESDHSSDRKSVSFEVVDGTSGDNNNDGGRGGSDFNESDFNIDDCADIIQAASRQFGGDDDDPFIDHNNTATTQSSRGSPQRAQDDDDLRRSNLLDLYKAQFMATSQLNGNLDFDPSELKEVYRQSLGGVEEEDEDANRRDQLIRHHTSMGSKQSLSHFEEEENKKNLKRRQSKRMSKHSMRIEAWHQKYSLQRALRVAELTPEMEWLSSFYRCDPRWQIQAFFDEVAREGGDAQMSEDLAASPLALLFNKANVFTVWRPTSDEAIKNMMLGIATGKGLDIKGKSAKRGNISSYVPFIQIYEEPHKEHVRAFLKDGRTIRVFYQSEVSRNSAYEMILDIKDFMLFAAQDAMRILSDEYADEEEQELAMKHLMYDDSNLGVTLVDKYAHASTPVFGLDITERLFWESYVMMQDCSRPSGSEWDIGRKSEPTFMDFNFKSVRREPGPGEPRAVVYQFSEESPIEPRTLLMAYEEYGMVKPVVSDFDCFLLGSRGVKYKHPIPPNQVELVKWSVNNISDVLDERAASQSDSGWMAAWFKVLKKAAMRNYVPITPKYGNGDPKSYEIIEVAVSRLQGTGCVRHGAECFNWYFPQEIDDEFLVISDTLPGNVKWKKMNVFELQEILMTKIDEGFTFPLNPKWVLCDPGWRRVYDKLLASQKRNVQDSINCWLPPETGLREQIDAISRRHPLGFEGRVYKVEGTEVMDKMEEELERYRRVQALWRKARALVWWIIFLNTKSQTIRLEAMQRQYQR